MTIKRISLIVVLVITAASLTVIAVMAAKISPLITSISEQSDVSFDDLSIKAEASGISSSSIASLMPLAQAFAGESFAVQGTIDLPAGTTAVTLPGLDLNLMETAQAQAAVQASGWAITQKYTTPDSGTSVAVLTDDNDNNTVFAVTTPPAGQTPAEYIAAVTTDYSDMATLFGFDVTSSSVTTVGGLTTITATQGDTVLKAEAWVDPSNPTKVNIAALKTTADTMNLTQAEKDFAAFVALQGGK